MTDLDLDDIQARADAATEGPWTAHTAGERGGDHWYICDEGESIAHVSANDGVNEDQREPDAEFIAHAREDVPALIARVRELETKNTTLGVERARLHDALDRVASYGLNLTEVFRPHTAEHEVGGEIIRRIKMNPPPVGGKP